MKHKTVFFLSLVVTLLFYGAWWKSTLLSDLDNKLYDVVAAAEPQTPSSHATLIVEIDEKSLQAFGQWPWPRVVMAELLKKIGAMNPSATAIDIIFPEQDRTSPLALGSFYRDFFHLDTRVNGLPEGLWDNDRLFADAIGSMNVTLPVFFDSEPSAREACRLPSAVPIPFSHERMELFEGPYLLCNYPTLQNAARGIGHIQASADNDGTFRRLALFIQYNDVLIPTLSMAAASTLDEAMRLTSGGEKGDLSTQVLGHTLLMDTRSQVLLRFYPRQWYHRVSALDVLSGKADPALFKGKFVFIGATAMGLYDQHTLSDGSIRPGVFAHATLIENMFDRTLMVQPSHYKRVVFLMSFVIAAALMVLMYTKRYLWVLVLFTLAVIGGLGVSYVMVQQNVYVSIGYFLIPLSAYLFLLSIVLFVIDYRDRKRFFEKMSKANEAMIDSMALVAETRDTETGAHIIRTKEYIRLLADYLVSQGVYTEVLTPEYITDLYHAAPLHDIGKVGISDEILKKSASLSIEEFEVMKAHTMMGKEIIGNAIHSYKNTSMLEIAYNIAYYHHEKWDGTGYPNGLKGDEIPLEARMMALADVYDALISRRRYKKAFGYEEAEEIITQGRGVHFDPVMVDAFVALKEQFKAVAERTRTESAEYAL